MNFERKDPSEILEEICSAIIDRTDASLAQLKEKDKRRCVAAALELYDLHKRLRRMSEKKCASILVDPSTVCTFPQIWSEDRRTTTALAKMFGQETIGEKRRLYFEAVRDVLQFYGAELVKAVATIVSSRRAFEERRDNSTKDITIELLAKKVMLFRFGLAIEQVAGDIFYRAARDADVIET